MALTFRPFNQATDIELTYQLLKQRQFSISHQTLPEFSQHQRFCQTHPYREWYLVFTDGDAIGSFYLTFENAIGINLNQQDNRDWFSQIIEYVTKHYQPLPATPSVTPDYFYINVPFNNVELSNYLSQQGFQPIQCTYKLSK